MKNKKGFTLVELLAVIVILAVIISIASGSVVSVMNRARAKTAMDVRNNLAQVAITFVIDQDIYLEKCPVDFSENLAKNTEITADILATNTDCYRKVTVEEVKKEGLFEDGRGFCNDTDTVIVYRYNDINENSEYKAFISNTICNN